MIEEDKTFGSFDIFCDEISCGYSDQFHVSGDFYQAIKEAKEYGWSIKKDGDDWLHICPSCNKKE